TTRLWTNTLRMLYGTTREEVMTNNELSNLKDENLTDENEIAQIFRIDTNLFDFDTPLCQAFKTFNYLSQIDVDNDGIPWVNEKPLTDDGVWSEPIDNIHHECNPLRNSIQYEDYEWYNTIEDSELNEEDLINKRILEESMNMMKESSNDEWDHDSPVEE
ncbi:hypothetical protein Tco_1160798, partial [Tanacetum coccineum]